MELFIIIQVFFTINKLTCEQVINNYIWRRIRIFLHRYISLPEGRPLCWPSDRSTTQALLQFIHLILGEIFDKGLPYVNGGRPLPGGEQLEERENNFSRTVLNIFLLGLLLTIEIHHTFKPWSNLLHSWIFTVSV